MSNKGVHSGIRSSQWRQYVPELRGFGSGAITQPTGVTAWGQYLQTRQGFTVAQGRFDFDSSTSFGSGETIWGIKLPVPASRSNGGADLPLGTIFAWQGAAADPQLNMNLTATLMDPFSGGGNRGNEDYYIQGFLPHAIAFGSDTFASAATTKTVTHGLGITPNVYDVIVTATNSPSTNPKVVFVTNTTSTTFDVNVAASATTTPLTFAWKARVEPNSSSASGFSLLMAKDRPWTFASGHVITFQVMYESRR